MLAEKKQEFTRRISQANSTDMIVVIYDITLEYLEEAGESIIANDNAALSKATIQIRQCINELIGSLNYDYSPSGELLSLYIYCSKRLVAMQLHKDTVALEEIKNIIIRLRDAYAQIAPINSDGPVMSNSQSVYAGLTYGKGSLNEDVIGSGNRGFLA